eukprot:2241412-Prymnesium_polylepis.2
MCGGRRGLPSIARPHLPLFRRAVPLSAPLGPVQRVAAVVVARRDVPRTAAAGSGRFRVATVLLDRRPISLAASLAAVAVARRRRRPAAAAALANRQLVVAHRAALPGLAHLPPPARPDREQRATARRAVRAAAALLLALL